MPSSPSLVLLSQIFLFSPDRPHFRPVSPRLSSCPPGFPRSYPPKLKKIQDTTAHHVGGRKGRGCPAHCASAQGLVFRWRGRPDRGEGKLGNPQWLQPAVLPEEGLGCQHHSGEAHEDSPPAHDFDRYELVPVWVLKKAPRKLTFTHLGGSIGAGFFVGSGGALAKGGPATLLLDFAIIGIMMFNVGRSSLIIAPVRYSFRKLT